jgi:hypothetical protein
MREVYHLAGIPGQYQVAVYLIQYQEKNMLRNDHQIVFPDGYRGFSSWPEPYEFG